MRRSWPSAGMQLNAVKATTTYEEQRLDFTTNIKEKTRELDATGQLVLHPDHQEVHLPQLAVRTQGVEWRTAPGSNATVKYGRGRVELENVNLVSGDQALDVSGTLALGGDKPVGRHRRARAQRGHPAAGDAAPAEPRLHRAS